MIVENCLKFHLKCLFDSSGQEKKGGGYIEQIFFFKFSIIQTGLQQIDIHWLNFHHIWLLAAGVSYLAFGRRGIR